MLPRIYQHLQVLSSKKVDYLTNHSSRNSPFESMLSWCPHNSCGLCQGEDNKGLNELHNCACVEGPQWLLREMPCLHPSPGLVLGELRMSVLAL